MLGKHAVGPTVHRQLTLLGVPWKTLGEERVQPGALSMTVQKNRILGEDDMKKRQRQYSP